MKRGWLTIVVAWTLATGAVYAGEAPATFTFAYGAIGAAFFNPEVEQVVAQRGYPVLLDLGKANVPFQSSGLVTSRRYLRPHPQIVENLARAVVEGVAFVQNPANKKNRRGQHRAQSPAGRCRAPGARLSDDQRIVSAQTLSDPARHRVGAQAHADMSLCKKLDDSGFFDHIRQ
jgi:ABC-type nitrate/sulfonate/bicarbonate transport system substrate-binding protein